MEEQGIAAAAIALAVLLAVPLGKVVEHFLRKKSSTGSGRKNDALLIQEIRAVSDVNKDQTLVLREMLAEMKRLDAGQGKILGQTAQNHAQVVERFSDVKADARVILEKLTD